VAVLVDPALEVERYGQRHGGVPGEAIEEV